MGTSIGLNLLKMHQFAIVVTNNTDESINWASQDTLEEICKRPLDHVINEQLNNLSLPFSWSLSEPSLFSSAGEYQKLLETCRDAGTVIHALTGKGPSINDVSSEGEGGGPPTKPIYYISPFSNLSRQGPLCV